MKKKARHPSGKIIEFDEEKHEYRCNEEKYISVTTFVNRFFPKFDADTIARRCLGTAKYKEFKTADEIIRSWADNRDEAAAFGTKVHLYAENKVLGKDLPLAETDLEIQAFSQVDYVLDLFANLEIIDVEKIVFSPTLRLSGTIDMLAKDKDTNTYYIIDWKTNKKLTMTGNKTALHPVEDLRDCNYSKYILQLNTYRAILINEGYVDGPIDLKIIHINRDVGIPQVYDVDIREDLMEKLLIERQSTMSARLEDYMALARKNTDKWLEDNPGKHPVEMYKAMAEAVVQWIAEDGKEEVTVNCAAFNGGVPEYSYAICYLKESKINVRKEI